jgi:hypothetical protein
MLPDAAATATVYVPAGVAGEVGELERLLVAPQGASEGDLRPRSGVEHGQGRRANCFVLDSSG